ncbi:MAG: D-alanyl-D-alanine carboxypeptidase [Clostridiales bacterium]|nr:D-alanyl-D-alanine carboxypeptidase [Clostridiales bacterium]
MRKKHLLWRMCSFLIAFTILFSAFSSSLLADGEEQKESNNQSSSLQNPVEGLLDPNPSGLPIPGAESYLIYDALSDTMLIGYQYDMKRAPAAISQIMTVLLALENLEFSDTITITKEMYETIPEDYVRIGFSEGEVVTVEQCVYASLLKSANDACIALAVKISGSEDAFVDKMNQRAVELGCTNTHFTNSYGLSDGENKTTCQDMSLILKEALRHPDFSSISTCTSYTIDPTNTFNDRRVLNNANRFISTPSTAYEYYIGGKTGYSAESGYTIIAGAEKDGRRLIGVFLGANDAENRYLALSELFEYCFTNYTTTMIEETELSGSVKNATSQIENAIIGTNLKISNSSLRLLEYYTIHTSVANGGYGNEIDFDGVVIDPQAKTQELNLPIYRTFSNNASYKIGYLNVTIIDESRINEEDETVASKSDKKDTKEIIVTILIVAGLTLLAGAAIFLFVKMVKKRRFNKTHRNPRIL